MKWFVKLLLVKSKEHFLQTARQKKALITHWFVSFAEHRNHEMFHPQQHIKYVQKWNCSCREPWTLSSWCVHFNGLRGRNKPQKDPFMKLNYLFCVALKPCMQPLVQGTPTTTDCRFSIGSSHQLPLPSPGSESVTENRNEEKASSWLSSLSQGI